MEEREGKKSMGEERIDSRKYDYRMEGRADGEKQCDRKCVVAMVERDSGDIMKECKRGRRKGSDRCKSMEGERKTRKWL